MITAKRNAAAPEPPPCFRGYAERSQLHLRASCRSQHWRWVELALTLPSVPRSRFLSSKKKQRVRPLLEREILSDEPGRAAARPAHDYIGLGSKRTRTTAGRHRVNNCHLQMIRVVNTANVRPVKHARSVKRCCRTLHRDNAIYNTITSASIIY